MKYRASEIIKAALEYSQVGESEAISWAQKVSFLNSEFASLWDDVLGHQDDFERVEVLIHDKDLLPADLYTVQDVRAIDGEKINRARGGELPTSVTYSIVNNTFYTRRNDSVRLIYTKTPPTITFPDLPIELKGPYSYKTSKGFLVSHLFNSTDFTIQDLNSKSSKTISVVLGENQYITKFDILNNMLICLVADSILGPMLYVDGIVSHAAVDFVVNDHVEFTTDGNDCWRLNWDLTKTQLLHVPPLSRLVDGDRYRLNVMTLERYITETKEWIAVDEDVEGIICADPFILVRKNDYWNVYSNGIRRGDYTVPSGFIHSASWDDKSGYGLIIQRGSSLSLCGFYPDTVLDWPHTAYFDWLIAALAVQFRKQIGQPIEMFEAEEQKRKERLQAMITRDRGGAYRLRNPYSNARSTRW